jgi:hypothetical protein
MYLLLHSNVHTRPLTHHSPTSAMPHSMKEHVFIAEGTAKIVRASKDGNHVVFVTFDTGEEGASDEVPSLRLATLRTSILALSAHGLR